MKEVLAGTHSEVNPEKVLTDMADAARKSAQAVEQLVARTLLKAAIQKSGLSSSQFAAQVMSREPRTIRRWLIGKSPIPKAAVMFLSRYVERKP